MFRLLRHSVNGFTVMEILVTMVISGIVVLTAFEFYNIFNKLQLKKNDSMEVGQDVLQFYNVLKNDAAKAISIDLSTSGLIMMYYNEDLVQYVFFDESVIRNRNIVSDTFRIKVVNLNSVKHRLTGFGKVLTMELEKGGQSFPMFIEKTYTSDVLLNAAILPNKQSDGY